MEVPSFQSQPLSHGLDSWKSSVIVSSWLIKTRRQDQSHCFSGTITPLTNELTLLFQGFKRPIQKFTWEKMHQTQRFSDQLWWSHLSFPIPLAFVRSQDTVQLLCLKNLSGCSTSASGTIQRTDLYREAVKECRHMRRIQLGPRLDSQCIIEVNRKVVTVVVTQSLCSKSNYVLWT